MNDLLSFFNVLSFLCTLLSSQMQQRNTAVVDMEAKLNEMKSKSEEYTDKVSSCFFILLCFFFSSQWQLPVSGLCLA